MVIDHQCKYIFVHVPRTGGNSFYKMIGGRTPGSGTLHKRRCDIKENYFSFGFIRNPWDRLYSCYRKHRNSMPDIYGEMKFRDYILGGGYRHGNEYSAMDHLYGCNYIGRFESLQNHWSKIFKLIGVANDKLPHVNNIGDPEYRDKYDKEMINYIGTRYKDDVKWGRYNFG